MTVVVVHTDSAWLVTVQASWSATRRAREAPSAARTASSLR